MRFSFQQNYISLVFKEVYIFRCVSIQDVWKASDIYIEIKRNIRMTTPLHELVPLILEAKRFFTLGLPRDGEELDSIQRGVMSRLTVFWYARTSDPGRASTG